MHPPSSALCVGYGVRESTRIGQFLTLCQWFDLCRLDAFSEIVKSAVSAAIYSAFRDERSMARSSHFTLMFGAESLSI